jgi:hypothetical protein
LLDLSVQAFCVAPRLPHCRHGLVRPIRGPSPIWHSIHLETGRAGTTTLLEQLQSSAVSRRASNPPIDPSEP